MPSDAPDRAGWLCPMQTIDLCVGGEEAEQAGRETRGSIGVLVAAPCQSLRVISELGSWSEGCLVPARHITVNRERFLTLCCVWRAISAVEKSSRCMLGLTQAFDLAKESEADRSAGGGRAALERQDLGPGIVCVGRALRDSPSPVRSVPRS